VTDQGLLAAQVSLNALGVFSGQDVTDDRPEVECDEGEAPHSQMIECGNQLVSLHVKAVVPAGIADFGEEHLRIAHR